MTVNLRIWGLACGVATVAVLAGGWFIGVQPQLATAATTAQSAAGVDAQNQATSIKIAALTKASANLDDMKVQDAVLQKSVPSILKPNTFIRRVSEVAALDAVKIVSISPGDAAAYTAPDSSDPSALVVGKPNPLINASDFTVVPVAIVVSGAPDSALQFAHDIQNDQRTFLINGVGTSTSNTSTDVTATLSGYIYVLKR